MQSKNVRYQKDQASLTDYDTSHWSLHHVSSKNKIQKYEQTLFNDQK